MTNREALIILNAIPGLGNKTTLKLLKHFGCAQEVFALSSAQLEEYGVSKKVAASFEKFDRDRFLKSEIGLIAKNKVEVLTFQDEAYPEDLREIPDAPIVLYLKGRIPPSTKRIGIVGSRRASLYGLSTARKFAGALAELDFVVVSGLARGIDTAAHQGALVCKESTIAVLGSGLACLYPSENERLADKIVEQDGAVISEFPMTMSPLPYNFPRRNRIVSGLSQGVIVVEAAKKSGALITADFALEQGREVYAIPGKVDNPAAQGVNDLIKQGAKLITSVDDILEDLHPKVKKGATVNGPRESVCGLDVDVSDLSEGEQEVFKFITNQPVHLDEIATKCGSDVSPTVSVLMKLELKKKIKQLPGKYFVR